MVTASKNPSWWWHIRLHEPLVDLRHLLKPATQLQIILSPTPRADFWIITLPSLWDSRPVIAPLCMTATPTGDSLVVMMNMRTCVQRHICTGLPNLPPSALLVILRCDGVMLSLSL